MTDICANVKEISGYSLYNSMIKKRGKHNPLLNTRTHYPPLSNKKYSIIYADPPWDYGGKTQFDKSLVKKENPKYEKKIFLSSATFKYPTLRFKALKITFLYGRNLNNNTDIIKHFNRHLKPLLQ